MKLTEQEVRNSIAISINREFYDWLVARSQNPSFRKTINQTERAEVEQAPMELALRFFTFINVDYTRGLDVHEYLDNALYSMASNVNFDYSKNQEIFDFTFELLDRSLGEKPFKKWDGSKFTGKFLMSAFEAVSSGIASNIDDYKNLSAQQQTATVEAKIKELWSNSTFQKNSGAGVRGTTRLTNILPNAKLFMKP